MNILKYRYITYVFSLILVLNSVYFLVFKGLNFSTEFTGGTKIVFTSSQNQDDVNKELKNILNTDYKISKSNSSYSVDVSQSFDPSKITEIKGKLSSEIKDYNMENLEVVQPSVGHELIYKTLIAVGISIVVIFIFIWYAFKDFLSSLSAMFAMLHDTIILVGTFSVFSYFLHAEIDLLFVTAVLTVLSFSLYDTIVIFDKIRDLYNKSKTTDYYFLINKSISQTMVRSINNSLTSIIVLFALALFVQGSLFWFTLALLLGVILGTYSSPFVAATLYFDLRGLKKKLKR
ncbi:protein translocase subunit SecF [candidate division WWE3 bacterium CG10_big_fil_rev_8_21_14_0_10_32_10]|uniref:Protein-export membrane protein SecF n=1 Tax=candidate division WWE3 bacterium CG10_big_fil_rev_8_21_14_0_10_32_10 TaxID=1975090 RepID=A0A2H0RA01_UNCKA|nr:MAG: protein translocase subunit SecF [candidate division WWE3 bacterium CG10_big_fil_rev_8_21_14_0_10_32_10]